MATERTGLGGGRGGTRENLATNKTDDETTETIIEPVHKNNYHLLIPLAVGGAILLGSVSFLFLNSSSIEMICRQVGNCQKFKEDATSAHTTLKKAEDSFRSAKSVPQLFEASKLIDEARASLSTIPDNAIEIAPPISEQKLKVSDLDKKIAVALALEQNADKTVKEAISKIASADQLDRNPQGAKEQPEDARKRLNKPKALYVEAQTLLRSIPDNSFVANRKKEKLKQVAEKITDLDGKLSTIIALDPCVVNPDACKPPDPCIANPTSCEVTKPPTGLTFCEINPAACDTPPPRPEPNKKPLFGPDANGRY
jgi:hypothetical protein